MERRRFFGALALTASLLLPELAAQAQDDCLEGTLWEPYTEVCAEVRDLRNEFMPPTTQSLGAQQSTRFKEESEGLPVPGGLAVGIIYGADQLLWIFRGDIRVPGKAQKTRQRASSV